MPNILALILFPIYPFLSFLIACTNLRNRANGFVFVLFYALFGYCHTFADMRTDAFRKAADFRSHFSEPFSETISRFADGEIMDVYESMLFSVMRSFTDNPSIMMMVVGFIVGFFVLKVLQRVLSDYPDRANIVVYALAFMVFLSLSPVHLGGVRNITALSLFIYSTIRFLVDKRSIWIIGVLITPFIHFSYIVCAVVVIIIRVVRLNWRLLYWPVIIVCAASMFLDTSSWAGLIGDMGAYVDNESIVDRAESYADVDTDNEFSKSVTVRILSVQQIVMSIFMILMLLYLKRNWHRFSSSKYTQRLLDISMVLLLLGYTLSSFSVVGQRYLTVAMLMFYLFCLNIYRENSKQQSLRYYLLAMPIVNIGNIAWMIYNSYSVVGTDIFFMPLPLLVL